MKKTQHRGSDKKPSMLETRTAKTNAAESSHGSVSDSRRPLVKLEEHMANKIVMPLQSLVSCLLEPPMNRRVAVGAIEDSGRSYFVAVAQVGGGSSVLNLLCTKDQANENCEHRSGIWQIFWQVVTGLPQHVFPTAFSSRPLAPFSQDLSPMKTHVAWLQELMKLRLLMSH